jgi:hypothetical protein
MQIIKEIFISFFFGTIIAFVIIFSTVNAYAAEIPSIEEPCGLSTEEFEHRLKHELKPLAKTFLEAEEKFKINACFLASVSALESGWGRYHFIENNIFGFGRKTFESKEECILFVAEYLRKNYLNEDGKYFRGGTISAIGKIWCPDDGTWVRLVTGIYGGLANE